jgi:hypothetical protein
MPRSTAAPEAEVLRFCLELLKLRGVFAWRNNNAGIRRRDKAGREFYAFSGAKGSADIFAIWHGRFISIECKRTGGKMTEYQDSWLRAVRDAGGAAWVVCSAAELDEQLKALGVWR